MSSTQKFRSILLAGVAALGLMTTTPLSAAPLTLPGGTPNQQEIILALNNGSPTNDIFVALQGLTGDALDRALANLTGEIHSSLNAGLIGNTLITQNAILGRLVQDPIDEPPAFWVQGGGEWDSLDGTNGTADINSRSAGITGGFDWAAGSGLRLGIAGGYSNGRSSASALSSSARTNRYDIALYGEGDLGDVLHVRAGGGFGYFNIDTTRSITVPTAQTLVASYSGQSWYAFGELSHRSQWGSFQFEPLVDVNFIHLRTGSFTETGGTAALTGMADNQDVAFTTIGARLSSPFTTGESQVAPNVMLGWRHGYGDLSSDVNQVLNGNTFNTSGTPISRDALAVNAGLDVLVRPGLKVNAAYLGQFSSRETAHGVTVTIGWNF